MLVCTPFKTYFERSVHPKNTRNNGISVKLPKARLEFGKKGFYYQLNVTRLARDMTEILASQLFRSIPFN